MERTIRNIESIKSVNFNTYPNEKILLDTILTFLSLISIFFLYAQNYLLFILIPIAIAIVLYSHNRKHKIRNNFYKNFASLNGFDYIRGDQSIISDFLAPDGSMSLENSVKFKLHNHNVSLFDYSKKDNNKVDDYYMSIVEIEFDHLLPQLLLAPRVTELNTDIFGMPQDDIKDHLEISLEGNAKNEYQLFVEKNMQIEALQIFTPDLISEVYKNYKNPRIKIKGKLICINSYRIFNSVDNLKDLLELSEILIEKLDRIAVPIERTVKEIRLLNNK